MRIVSLVPSLTEYLLDLGLGDQVVGRTRFCIHPRDRVRRIDIVGGTKNPSLSKIRSLKPDLIVANREENRKEDIDTLQERVDDGSDPADVMVTQIRTVEEALSEMMRIGRRCGREKEAQRWVRDIQGVRMQGGDRGGDRGGALGRNRGGALCSAEGSTQQGSQGRFQKIRVAYLIWRDPWMTIGSDTYIHSVLEEWGFQNIFSDQERYPVVTLEEIRRRHPACILLSSEPFPFKEKHQTEIEMAIPDTRAFLINGEWTSWYGSRMKIGFEEMNAFRERVGNQLLL